MSSKLLLIALLTTWSLIHGISSPNDSELELVQVLFRHGERTPLESETYPRDPYSSSLFYEPWGWGQLTELGRYRMRRLGQALRRRYGGFLRTLSGSGDIYAHSANNESCLTSLRLLIEGLRINEGTVAIHSHGNDILMNSRACSKYQTELKKIRQLPEVIQTLAKYEGLFSYVMDNTGVTFDGLPKDQRLYQLYNLLETQRSMNLSLPNWCPEGVFNLLNEIAYLHFNLESYTQALKILNGGPLVRRFLESMLRSKSRNNIKIYLYSGEDHNVAAFSRALDRRFPRVPNYGNAIILEKYRTLKSARALVRMVIWTGVTEKLFPVRLRGCTEVCPLEDYAKIVAKSLPTNEDMRCHFNDAKEHKNL
ncbi:PREDICTED: venom acid phosphatase Acph-1-like [Ceratosolen solmsi marchali]|uniref:Venom acid phosphatase Acph-1-like n=1 Tax=Ceratosolen solmsi marchali TaxID=326594 RepID=A0AAJ7DWZ6_9HYME|nr:PREDICTED: venom acid phosphatase Acph-1-like [Ceratosolen solmsi marchali]